MKKTISLFASVSAALLLEAAPTVTSVTMTPSADGSTATIAYTLSEAPAIVTLDILKDGVPLSNRVWRVSGDVNRVVTATSGTIVWECGLDWPEAAGGASGVTAKVTAYAKTNPPKYMVVSLVKDSDGERISYYEDDYLIPDGVQAAIYKTSKVVLRHIPARGVTWTMGSPSDEKGRSSDETQHEVTMSNDYWMAIYETTAAQSGLGGGYGQTTANFDVPMRPVQKLQWTALRNDESAHTPPVPAENFILGKFRTLTGLDFDLPSEAQWEFACRAGNYGSTWNDGSAILSKTEDANLGKLARYKRNSGYVWATTAWIAPSPDTLAKDGLFAIVGSYKPNPWGLYDMHGNGGEWCLDCYQADITGLGGAVCTNETLKDGHVLRVFRGGYFATDADGCRSAKRSSERANNWYGGLATYRLTCQGDIPRGMDAPVVAPSALESAAVTFATRAANPSAPVASAEDIDTVRTSFDFDEEFLILAKPGLLLLFK